MFAPTMPRSPALSPRSKTSTTKPTAGDFDLKKSIGTRIAALRNQHGWMLKEMASKLDVGFSVYTKWEYGMHVPPVDKLIQLAELMQTTIDYLLTGNRTEGKPLHNTRLLERLHALESLPSEDMEAAITVLDGLVIRHEVEATVNRRSSRKNS
jgi:transcriptional regulator with XRE-family HTH domain